MNRANDRADAKFKRHNRFFSKDNAWYFQTREKTQLGPFLSREQAEAALERYLMDHASFGFDPWDSTSTRNL